MRAYIRTRSSTDFGRIRLIQQNLVEVDQAGRIRQNLVKRRFTKTFVLVEFGRIYLLSILLRHSYCNQASPIILSILITYLITVLISSRSSISIITVYTFNFNPCQYYTINIQLFHLVCIAYIQNYIVYSITNPYYISSYNFLSAIVIALGSLYIYISLSIKPI